MGDTAFGGHRTFHDPSTSSGTGTVMKPGVIAPVKSSSSTSSCGVGSSFYRSIHFGVHQRINHGLNPKFQRAVTS